MMLILWEFIITPQMLEMNLFGRNQCEEKSNHNNTAHSLSQGSTHVSLLCLETLAWLVMDMQWRRFPFKTLFPQQSCLSLTAGLHTETKQPYNDRTAYSARKPTHQKGEN